jgi:hypothetical protein
VPYKDPERRRAYDREYKRTHRRGPSKGGVRPARTPTSNPALAEIRLATARDVLTLLEEEVNAVRGEPNVGVLERARTVGYLAGVALRAVEAADLESRLDALERTVGAAG